MQVDDLEPTPTLHSYLNDLLKISGDLLADMRSSDEYHIVDEHLLKMDEILIQMRHADWKYEIG